MQNYIRHGDLIVLKDAVALLILDRTSQAKLQELHEATQRRAKFLRDIVELAEDGKIVLVESGRDCDGVEYDGNTHEVPANKKEVEDYIEYALNYADGPMYFVLMRPSEARKVQYTSRDRTMEAFENGHPWSI